MRFRVGLVLCLFVAYIAAGCRTALAPNIDRNFAPETWITAAPMDTITVKDPNGKPVEDPVNRRPTTIPVRFHVYWAGSDQDGAIAGYYWAVTETLPMPEPGFLTPPNLPGPKPSSYHYTTRSDSTFIFNVAEDIPDRQHAFFVYSVDNQGKADPTPARFIFNAQDRFPPIPIFLESKGVGTVYQFNGAGQLVAVEKEFPITDQDIGNVLRDTVSANSTLIFRWTSQVQVANSYITGYRYRLDEPDFISVPPTVTQAIYHSGVGADTVPVAPGRKTFRLRAVDQAGGTQDSTRRFIVNFSPDTWWSGPDANQPFWRTNNRGEKYVTLTDIKPGGSLYPGGITGSLLSPDSVQKLPATRPYRKTFIEFWNDTLFFRNEGDTVHMNSYAILHNGGFDTDSPYLVRVSALGESLSTFPGGIVLKPNPQPNGSPIGFHLRQEATLSAGSLTGPPSTLPFGQTGLYPVFDPNDVSGTPRIANYWPNYVSGTFYALALAEDGDGALDGRITNARQVGDNPSHPLRTKVLVYHINRNPYFRTDNPAFLPRPGFNTFTSENWALNLPAADPDPYYDAIPPTPRGNSSGIITLRRRITVEGTDRQGQPLKWEDPFSPYINQDVINIVVPSTLAPGPATLVVELCDCEACEARPGTGRCVTARFPVIYAPPGAEMSSSQSGGDRR